MTRGLLLAIAGVLLLATACNGQFRFNDPDGGAVDSAPALCTSDSDCHLSLSCDVVSGACVACLTDAQCSGTTPRCDVALHRCVQCGTASDCASNQTCESSTRTCVQTCEEGSVTEHECPASAPTCNEVAQFCTRCSSDADCKAISDDGQHCNGGGQCVRCLVDTDCTDLSDKCDQLTGKCVDCTSSLDCSNGEMCDPMLLQCM